MDLFKEYILNIEDEKKRNKFQEIITWINNKFPNLHPRMAWNQPTFTDHGTYIIGLNVAKNHIAISPEQAGMLKFTEEIKSRGYSYTPMLFRVKWDDPIDYDLLEQMIIFNIEDKANTNTFRRH